MIETQNDIGCDIGPLFGLVCGDKPKYPMYSYERPTWLFWQGFYNKLLASGYTHVSAIELMQNSSVRHGLDQFEDEIKEIGEKFAKGFCSD